MNQNEWQLERTLERAGWSVDYTPPWNASEEFDHTAVKLAVAHSLVERGLRFTVEAEHAERGIADVLCHGGEGVRPFVVEVERGGSDPEVRKAQVDQYYGEELYEVHTLDPDEAPERVDELVPWVKEELFGGVA